MWCGGVCSYSMDIWARVGNVLHCSSILHYIHSVYSSQMHWAGRKGERYAILAARGSINQLPHQTDGRGNIYI